MKEFEINNRKAIFSETADFCVLSKQHDYIEVTEWSNGEGFDIDVTGEQHIHLTFGQFKLLKKLVKKLKE